ncbi:MAG: hypothetical protein P8K68_00210 [Algibacter sp.]|uniref:hypothetical protein n=1 Tax=Algibacter sp. TaxID=1872428 RepID=UPI00260F827A|nr:hypothetical protein [Algibacter sp.]MDG1728960.1 hypothetical protein [Algibacter sp.]MDG2177198.1 hypothetical protein [Algibacter sp.]
MSKNIELQEEFEALINELERLKSINEITSENSNNAKKTIDAIESFVQSVTLFKKSITEDYTSKKKDFEVIENSLNETLTTLNSNVEKQTKKFENLANNYTIESNKTLESVKEKLEVKIKDFASEINALKEKLETDITEFTKVTSKEIEDQSIKINKLIINNHNEVLKQFQLLNTKIETNKTQVKKLTFIIISCIVLAALCFSFLLYKYS